MFKISGTHYNFGAKLSGLSDKSLIHSVWHKIVFSPLFGLFICLHIYLRFYPLILIPMCPSSIHPTSRSVCALSMWQLHAGRTWANFIYPPRSQLAWPLSLRQQSPFSWELPFGSLGLGALLGPLANHYPFVCCYSWWDVNKDLLIPDRKQMTDQNMDITEV